MAIVQISKIIHRTGANVDLPQLDTGEVGYATDDRRIYIGDDSVLHPPATEGETTQTEILTEHSTLSFSKIGGTSNTTVELSDVKTGQLLVASGNSAVGNTWVNWDGNRIGPDNQKLILGSPSNLKITGGTSGMFLATDGLGNLTWTDSIGAVTIAGTPVGSGQGEIQFNTANDFDGVTQFKYDIVNSTLILDGDANITGDIRGNTLGDHNGRVGYTTPNSGSFTTIVTTSSITASGNVSGSNLVAAEITNASGILELRQCSLNGTTYDVRRTSGKLSLLGTDLANASAYNSDTLTSFNTTGFTDGGLFASGANIVSWTFRKQAKFFDVVTFTCDSSGNATINHNLGSVPGCIFVKFTTKIYSNSHQYY